MLGENQKAKTLKITCIQMDSKLACPDENYRHAEELICEAVKEQPDVIVLPEAFENWGQLLERLAEIGNKEGHIVKERIGGLAKKFKVNIVAGSVADLHDGKVYNTAFVFDRNGECVASYDKTHLVYPSEASRYAEGDRTCSFMLDGVKCGIIVCNDFKFPELIRKLALEEIEILFAPSAWDDTGMFRLRPLRLARAIENQIFVVNCNSCSTTATKTNGGESAIIDPRGNILALAGTKEEILSAECDMQLVEKGRENGQSIFLRRRPEVY